MFGNTIAEISSYAEAYGHRVDLWTSAWISILSNLFPASDGYTIRPTMITDAENSKRSHVKILLERLRPSIGAFRTILIILVSPSSDEWPQDVTSVNKCLQRVLRSTEASFDQWASVEVYWIASIGQHWCFGITKDDGKGPQLISKWHFRLHDADSYNSLQQLLGLINESCQKLENENLPCRRDSDEESDSDDPDTNKHVVTFDASLPLVDFDHVRLQSYMDSFKR